MMVAPSPASGAGSEDISRIRSRRPLQAEIRDAILSEFILSGKLQPGDRLPSETELASLFGASRVTIRTALQSLKDQGYIRIIRGSGSRVLPRPESIHSGVDRLSSFDTFATQSGQQILTADVEFSQVTSSADPLASVFETTAVTKVVRTKVINDRKVALIIDYVPEEVLPEHEIRDRFDGSVLDLLLADGAAEYSDCTLTPVIAAGEVLRMLDCVESEPLLQLSELTRNDVGEIINRSEAWLSPAAFTFQLRRRRED